MRLWRLCEAANVRVALRPPRRYNAAMKLNSKTRGTFVAVLFLSLLIGTLVWEIIERLLAGFGVAIDLSVGPIGFDAHVLAVWVRANTGTAAAVYPGLRFFQSL